MSFQVCSMEFVNPMSCYGLDKVVLDADLNAANNITFRYDKEHSISCSALDGQVVVNQPIVIGSSLASTDPLGSCVF